jgi:Na+-translocating ferredoxin:NAD+ oxidoreductase subunit B
VQNNTNQIELELAKTIDALLPQTQCGGCGYAGCSPYARAIAQDLAPTNRCAPGGNALIRTLSTLLNRPFEKLNPQHGQERPRQIALIDDQVCIGCAACISACPVDAIIGAPRLLHDVVAQWCSGCTLCVAACPVDCIAMEFSDLPWNSQDATQAKKRFEFKTQREHSDQEHARTAAQRDSDALLQTAVNPSLLASVIKRARNPNFE